MPENIARLAEEVTVDADNDYDRLLALQSWFRGTSFDYSLDAPVEEGFDGSGADAIGDFLEVRSGYCVHFASAFALMARTLDMPSRVVVGFLPGAPTGETADDERVYEATTAQLHAWPEVRFEGIGWVAFEPTKSLGSAQRFIAEDIDPSAPEPSASPAPSASASPSATAGPRADERDPESGSVAGGIDPSKLLPTLGLILGIAALIAAPALARRLRAASRVARVQGGSAGTAWRMVQDSALDLGIEVPAAESPRAFAARLTTEHGADPTALGRLTAAVERASYAAPDERGRPAGESLVADAASVHRSLRDAVSPGRRLAATVLPRSLIVRPGSTFAAATAANA
nr:transglutaminase domain-containing protein [Microbacterium marinum]